MHGGCVAASCSNSEGGEEAPSSPFVFAAAALACARSREWVESQVCALPGNSGCLVVGGVWASINSLGPAAGTVAMCQPIFKSYPIRALVFFFAPGRRPAQTTRGRNQELNARFSLSHRLRSEGRGRFGRPGPRGRRRGPRPQMLPTPSLLPACSTGGARESSAGA